MVAKKAAGVVGAGVGGAAGGFFNNPGVVAAIGIIAAIGLTLFFFQNDIRRFFGETIPEALSGIGQIQLPSINLPDITFPTFEFPDITFPSFPDIDIDFPSFDFSGLFGGEIPLPGAPPPFVGPERMDVPFGDTGETVDIVPGFGRDDPRRIPIGTREGFDQPKVVGDISEREPDSSLFALTTFGGGAVRVEQEQALALPTDPIPFAVRNVEETQAEFQERSMGFAEAFPNVAFSTSLTDEITSGRQLSRRSEDFQSVLEAEASRSESIFAALFGNVQNPEFGA